MKPQCIKRKTAKFDFKVKTVKTILRSKCYNVSNVCDHAISENINIKQV